MAVLSATVKSLEGRKLPLGNRYVQVYETTISNAAASDEWIATELSTIEAVLGWGVIGTGSAPVAATGTVTFNASDPTDEDTITVDGIVYTIQGGTIADFAYDVNLSTTEATMAANFEKAINNTGTAGTDYSNGVAAHPAVSASRSSAVVTLTARAPGSVGNAITLAASDDGTSVDISGATLSGGLDSAVANFLENAQGTGQTEDSSHGDLGVEVSRACTIQVTVLGRA